MFKKNSRRNRSMRSLRRRSRRRKSHLPVVIVSLMLFTGVLAGLFLLFINNPFFEQQLRAQYGEAFFSDFGISGPEQQGTDLESIYANYEPVFFALEDEALSRLEELFHSSIREYEEQEKAGTLDSFVLSNKYIQAGRMLEKSVDQIFEELLGEMQQELIIYSLPLDVVDEARQIYENAKEEKKRDLFDRLRSHVGG